MGTENKSYVQDATANSMVSYFSVNKKESKTVLDLPQLPPHLPPHPVPEKKRTARKKEMKNLNPITSRKNTQVLRELEDLEAHL